jgi:hypothetical protein
MMGDDFRKQFSPRKALLPFVCFALFVVNTDFRPKPEGFGIVNSKEAL